MSSFPASAKIPSFSSLHSMLFPQEFTSLVAQPSLHFAFSHKARGFLSEIGRSKTLRARNHLGSPLPMSLLSPFFHAGYSASPILAGLPSFLLQLSMISAFFQLVGCPIEAKPWLVMAICIFSRRTDGEFHLFRFS